MRDQSRCAHDDRLNRCVICALAELRRNLQALDAAVTGLRDKTTSSDYVRGGAPSWEPINLAALSLLQDIRDAGGLNHVEATLNTSLRPRQADNLQKDVRQWRNRAALILGQALAPYVLLWDQTDENGSTRTIPVACPVIDEHGECGAPLRVHREQDPTQPNYSRPVTVTCTRRDDHDWPISHGGVLRLGVLLGGVA